MKKLIVLAVLLMGFACEAQQSILGALPGTTLTNNNGINLTNLDYQKIVKPTTNNVYDARTGYINVPYGLLTSIQDALGNVVDMSVLTNSPYGVKQTQPLIITNGSYGGFWLWSPCDIIGLGGSSFFYFYTNASLIESGTGLSNCWAVSLSLGTNGSAVATADFRDGQGASIYANGAQFKTNTSTVYPNANVVLNRQTNLVINTATSGQIELTNTANEPVINIVAGLSNSFLRFSTVPQSTGNLDVDTWFEIKNIPSHGGAASLANGETVLSAGQLAITHERHLQIGLAGNNAAYVYAQKAFSGLSVAQPTNFSQPFFFKVEGRTNGVVQQHYPGFYSVYVNTNNGGAGHETYYTALAYKQNVGFDAENGTVFSIDRTNETYRAWGGDSNTLEVLTAAKFTTGIIPPFTSYSNYTTAATSRTMNTYAGKVLLASGSATYTVTDSLVATTSAIVATLNAVDTTGIYVVAVPGSGSFTLTVPAAATANLPISWQIISP